MAAARIILYSDLDGTFLDALTYSWETSLPALSAALECNMPVVFCSSKTGAEISTLISQLGFSHPFIAENGGGIFVPDQYFGPPPPDSSRVGRWHVLSLGTPYAALVAALREVRSDLGLGLRGFSDMSTDEVARLCDFSAEEARLAIQRNFDEPFVVESARDDDFERFRSAFRARGLQVTRGGRFFHLTGNNDKGIAVRRLNAMYLGSHDTIVTAGLGDSANDLPMLQAVDHPYIVQKPDGSHDAYICSRLPEVSRVPGIGPAGWAMATTGLIQRLAKPPACNPERA